MPLQRTSQIGPYRLTRKFAIGSAVIICLAAALLGYLSRVMAVDQLELMAQQNNAALTHAFANGVWPRFAPFVGSAANLTADEIVTHPETGALSEALKNLMAGTRVLKVKLYDLGGLTVFSTDPKQIGSDYSEKPEFLIAFDGGTASELEFRETFDAFGGGLKDRWVLSSYVPIRTGGASGTIEGVAEIYTDVTDFYDHVQRVAWVIIGVVALALGTVFVLLLGMVGWADRKIQRQHQRNLALTAATAHARAASDAKSEFLANMSHELRTPLNGIIGFSELIRDETMGPIGARVYTEYADHIRSSGVHLLNILSNVLDLVRIDSDKLALEIDTADVVAVVREAVQSLQAEAAAAQLTLSFDTEFEQLAVESDAGKIGRIVTNLAGNGIKYTPQKGAVSVAVQGATDASRFALVIADTGIGMREQDIPIALSPFGQVDGSLARKFSGVGLGLPLSYELAQLLGGDVAIESAPGNGTKVTVTLPRKIASGAPKRAALAA